MSIELRYYQREAIDSIYSHFENHSSNTLVALPTGTGKSIIIAEFVKGVLSQWPTQKIMMLTHVKELIEQNYSELMQLWPMAPCGIYSAGLGRKEIRPVTFAGIGSVVNKAAHFGNVDVIIIDECHLISPKDNTNYQLFIADLKKQNPDLVVIGLTATPYRMGQGLLTDVYVSKNGKTHPPLFGRICYNLTDFESFNRLIDEGYLCPLVTKKTDREVDISNVGKSGGEYKQNEMQATFDRNTITRTAISEIIEYAEYENRKRWLVFASGITHAEHVAAEFINRGYDAKCVNAKTAGRERAETVKWFKEYTDDARILVNNGVFTAGFNCPQLDVIAVLRATASASLWVQMLGRGTRPCPQTQKENCLVLDFAGNTARLGPINDPTIPKQKNQKQSGEAPVRLCENCGCYSHASARVCVVCSEPFPIAVKIKSSAGTQDVMRRDDKLRIEIFEIDIITYDRHLGRNGKPDSLKVVYQCGLRQFVEWICFEHGGFAARKARDWWARRGGLEIPASVDVALSRVGQIDRPSHLRVWLNPKHPQIKNYDFTGTAFGTQADTGKRALFNARKTEETFRGNAGGFNPFEGRLEDDEVPF